ncbi:methyltransferase domain-containing protein [Streptomyces profundus]|uniref:methyltransferase domain-containing protein n=1 Tax=Streptomyces profundus TaxID=2867410 RepID=UPI001D16D647|nr:methyltransferase domain-containing protein [Streptomyces sp. MA3_2.13]UED84492.1 methyltransferase [Streptomyces sp. MA3_2.13]
MTPTTGTSPQERLIGQVVAHLGRPVPPEWLTAMRTVPRDQFLPSRVWLRDGRGGYQVCERELEPARWQEAAWGDVPVVVRVEAGLGGEVRPMSSASAPGTVIAMLELADVRTGGRVLEIGTGTGWHAGLLSAYLGDAQVVSVELDGDLVERARASLEAVGRSPLVVRGDGARGWAAGASYDRIIATCSVRDVPTEWLGQLAAGGRIVAPWNSAWCAYGTLVADLDADGTLRGRWAAGGSYMPMRRVGHASDAAVAEPDLSRVPAETTSLSPWSVAGEDYEAQFAVGLLTAGVWHAWDTADDEPGVHAQLWLYAEDGDSTALVEVATSGTMTVRQAGARRLWDEVGAAWHWWRREGAPGMDRFGIDHQPGGTARLWLDTPDRLLPGDHPHASGG